MAVVADTRPHGARTIAARDFFDGVWSTTMGDDDLLVGVSFPAWGTHSGFAIEEMARRHGDFAIAGATIGIELDEDSRIERCAIALFGMGPTPLRATAAEQQATGQRVDEIDTAALGRSAVEDLTSIPDDLHGSAAYRTRVGAVMVARAWTSASEEATHG